MDSEASSNALIGTMVFQRHGRWYHAIEGEGEGGPFPDLYIAYLAFHMYCFITILKGQRNEHHLD
jgi:hypothetical protein